MPVKLSTTVKKIQSIKNPDNLALVNDYYQYIKDNGSSDSHQNNILKAIISFADFVGPDISFTDINRKEQIISFLSSKIKSEAQDPDKKWITTWFMRWLYNQKYKEQNREEPLPPSEWNTPSFAMVKKKTTKRPSPYLETELWELDEILCIIKYEPYKRNKAALALFWDLNARRSY